VKMLGGVLVLGRVATAHMSAGETQAQMNPGIASFNTVLAYMLVRRFDFDLVQVLAFVGHRILFFSGKVHFETRSSDLSHVTKGHSYSQEPHP
jgi:hypothetical protein